MYRREVELSGHIIDSLIIPKALDLIMDMGGDFEIVEFNVGKLKKDTSYAKLQVKGKSEEHLGEILDELSEIGAVVVEINEVELKPSPKDKTFPDEFYSTTNHPTYIRYGNQWIRVENIEMDCAIVLDTKELRAYCKPLAHIKKEDKIVVGREGIRVVPPERPRGKLGVFEFMSSEASTEKPFKSIMSKTAQEIKRIKDKGGKIALVGGPAIVHTGNAPVLAQMIKEGIIDYLFAGNALAVHDIENAIYGTSLGISTKTGETVARGHRHHIYAINKINQAGSIKDAVEEGILKEGIMYECVKNEVPFVLAGSIRDDGPLPEVITDVLEAQDAMRKYVQDVDMVIMIATMLHSIAIGNILPSEVKSICVDINPSTVTKLSDRGSAQVIGIVTDVGAFLPMLLKELGK